MIGAVALALGLLTLLAGDLLLARRPSTRPVRTAGLQFTAWSALGIATALPIALVADADHAVAYSTVLILEKTLSIDNVAVFATLLAGMGVAVADRPRRVGQGIGLALVLRTGLLLAGLAVVERVHALLPVMGVLLLLMGARMLRAKESTYRAPGAGRLGRFPAAGPLVALALTDIVFAVDSVPAALAVTRNPYLVVGATGMAMLGLRPAYTLLEHGLRNLRYLGTGVAAVLIALGVELMIGPWVHVPDPVTLAIAVTLLGGSALLSTASGVQWLRTTGALVGGGTLVVAGLVMLVLPGPGLLVLAAGLVLLGTEIPWLQKRLARGHDRLPERVRNRTPERLARALGRPAGG